MAMESAGSVDVSKGDSPIWRLADWALGGVVLFAWAGLHDQIVFGTPAWLGPLGLLAAWVALCDWTQRRGSRVALAAAGAVGFVALAALLPAWPGAATAAARWTAFAWALLGSVAWRGIARLATGPVRHAPENGRVLGLVLALLATWSAYFTARIVGVVDERWYGDLMTDFLGQLRAGVFPVLVGQGEFAWNGNVHPFRSAPMHHYLGGLADLLTLRQLAPLAVQHVALIVCEFAAVLVLYVGLRRLRPGQPWFAFGAALLFAFCPGVTMSQIQHDMYMTATALPALVVVVLALVRVLDVGSWRAWLTLGAGVGVVWFCHPPVAFLTTAAVGVAVLVRFVMAPVDRRDWVRAGAAGLVFVAVSAGYFFSMKDLSPLRHGYRPTLADVIVPGLGGVAAIAGLALLARARRAVTFGLAAGAVIVGGQAIHAFRPQLFTFAVATLGGWAVLGWIGRRFPVTRLDRCPELLLAVCALIVGCVLGPRLEGNSMVDQWIGSARAGYAQLWLPLRHGGVDQIGYVLALGVVGAAVLLCIRPRPAERVLGMIVLLYTVALAPIPGFIRFLWQQVPAEIMDIIGVAYPLRFLPVSAPFAVVLVYLALTDEARSHWGGRLRMALLCLLPWTAWEHVAVVQNSWRFRHSEAITRQHLRSENRAISKFHYDLMQLPRYHSHGVTDHRLETRLWERRAEGAHFVGPDQYADRMAAAQEAEWTELSVTPDPNYPAWLYLSPKVVLAPGERKLLTFQWLKPDLTGWLIFRSENIYREYKLPEFGESRSFGIGLETHHTLSFWNSGDRTEELELVIKREGPDMQQPYGTSRPPLRLRVVNYNAYQAPVEILRLAPLQLRTLTEADASVETFRMWLPGYRVSVDGQPVSYQRSHNGLLEYQVPAGSHVADIRFRGTPGLRLAVWWSLGVGAVLVVLLIGQGRRLARQPV